MNSFYNYYLGFVIILKIVYLISSLRLRITKRVDPKNKNIEIIEDHNEKLLLLTDLAIYGLLIWVFFPTKIKKPIFIDGHEKRIFFIFGIIGLLHTINSLYK